MKPLISFYFNDTVRPTKKCADKLKTKRPENSEQSEK